MLGKELTKELLDSVDHYRKYQDEEAWVGIKNEGPIIVNGIFRALDIFIKVRGYGESESDGDADTVHACDGYDLSEIMG
jgi:hypothetical protein